EPQSTAGFIPTARGRVEIGRLDPAARSRDEPGGALRLRPGLGRRALPDTQPAGNRTPLRRRQRPLGQIPALGDPGDDLAIGRIDKAMPETHALIDPDRGALDMKAA